MTILTGKTIKNLVQNGDILISPFSDKNVNQCSYDLSLGRYILILSDSEGSDNYKLIDLYSGPYILYPGNFVLAHTDEFVGVKGNVPFCWNIYLKSTLAREGLEHSHAGFVENGYINRLTLELSANKPIALKYGMPIIQAVFQRLEGELEDYAERGNYMSGSDIHNTIAKWSHRDMLSKNQKDAIIIPYK